MWAASKVSYSSWLFGWYFSNLTDLLFLRDIVKWEGSAPSDRIMSGSNLRLAFINQFETWKTAKSIQKLITIHNFEFDKNKKIKWKKFILWIWFFLCLPAAMKDWCHSLSRLSHCRLGKRNICARRANFSGYLRSS